MFGEIIPADRLTTWQGHVGVPGGIRNRSTVFQTLNPGATTAQIESAINNCPDGQVVYLNAGTYNIGQVRILNKSGWTLRGAGPGRTILKGSAWAAILNLGQFPWITEWPSANNFSAAAIKGATTITLSSTTGISANNLVFLEMDNVANQIYGFGSGSANSAGRLRDGERVQAQIVYVTNVSGSTISFTPPLNFDFPSERNPRAVGFNGKTGPKFAGIEDLTISGSTGGYGVWWLGAYGCWMQNVEVTNWDNWGIEIQYSVNMEVRKGYIHDPAAFNWGKGYAMQFDTANNCLIEDNLFYKFQDGFLLQGSCSGNVIAYNAFVRSYPAYNGVDIMLSSLWGNHTPFPTHNLFEGNYANGFHADYYYGPSAKGTLLRNYFPGSDPDVGQNRIVINIDSHQWDYSLVGNILGSVGTNAPIYSVLLGGAITWANKSPLSWTHGATSTDSFSYSANRLYRLGYPYIGNNGSSGTANPPTSSQLGHIDLSVKPGGSHETLLHGNWEYTTKSVVWNSGIAETNIPNSYYLTSKPAWFGSLPWPAYDPVAGGSMTAINMTNIPAGYRFVFGDDPPAGTGNQPPVAVANASLLIALPLIPISFSSAGSMDPEGEALTYNWNFGDGTTSTAANPSHSFASVGVYTVRLTVSDGVNSATATALTININLLGGSNQPPTAVASANPTNGTAPLAVAFSSAGSSDPEGTALSYLWTFGDGTTSTAANPNKTYSTVGNYVARLSVSDGVNTNLSANLNITVTALVNEPPVAVANATPTSGTPPLTVAFSSAGSSDPEGTPLTYNWTFGDGGASTAANPNHNYQSVGSYVARLTVSDGTNTVQSSPITINVVIPGSGLVAAYGFEEELSATSVLDSSGNSNLGTINGAIRVAHGWFGNAMSFNGSNSVVVINSSASLNLSSAMTLSAWVYPTASKPSWHTILQKESDAYYLHAGSPAGAMIPAGGGVFNGTESYVAGTNGLPLDTWTYLAVTYDGSLMRFYVRGVHTATAPASGGIQATSNPLRIGGNTYGQYFQGLIDEVRIYGRALNADEICTDMNTPIKGNLTGILLIDHVSGTPTRGAAPLTVMFAKQTLWAPGDVLDFGDGNRSEDPNTTHVYTTPGTYRVSVLRSFQTKPLSVCYITVTNAP